MQTSHYQTTRSDSPTDQTRPSQDQKAPFWKKLKLRGQEYFNWLWILILLIYISSSAVHSLINNYKSEKEITLVKKEISELKLEKARLEALIAYYNTDAYKEKELRKRLLLKRPEEYVIAFPEEVRSQKKEESSKKQQIGGPVQPNWQKWLDYFKGRAK